MRLESEVGSHIMSLKAAVKLGFIPEWGLCLCSALSCVQLCANPWTVARQAPPSMGFSRQEYWSGLPFPSPGYLPGPGIKPASLASPALAGGFSGERLIRSFNKSRDMITFSFLKNLCSRMKIMGDRYAFLEDEKLTRTYLVVQW